ncbi:MAG: SDR family oxidoreductase [Dermabacter sp.]|nr:SDR family oxidoreductase [Dermabacter sp.]
MPSTTADSTHPRTYVVTGARAGIGHVTARLLAEAGHRVIGVGRRDTDIVADLGSAAGRADGARAVVEAAGGTIDAVIACAGNTSTSATTVSVNYFGATEFLEALRPALAASPAPRAAVVTSMSVMLPTDRRLVEAMRSGDESGARAIAEALDADRATRALVEPSSKRALARWVRASAPTSAWADEGIALNAVGPGVALTEDSLALLAEPGAGDYVDAMVPMPLGHYQPPEAIAHLLIWLTSPENTHTSGQNIFCDGGADVTIRGEDIWSWNEAAATARIKEIDARFGSDGAA